MASPLVPVAATALLLALAWLLSDVLLLAFGGCLLALALQRMSQPLQRRLHVSPRWALALVILALVLLLALAFGVAGSAAAEQMQVLRETLPKALQALRAWLGQHAPGRWLLEVWRSAEVGPDDLSRLANVAGGTVNIVVGVLGSTALLVAIGIYLAADPGLYRRGFLRLWPAPRRALAERTLDAAGNDLSRWLMGQAVSMLAVGALTALGLAVIGMPLALSLGVIAALLDFVPYFGPIVSGVLVVAVALTEGQTQALWAAGVCLAVQQIESYLVQPLVQKWAVRLPPALGMLAVLVFGLLFGLPGVLLAVPLMVLSMTLVEHLWVQPGAGAPD